MKCGCLVEVDDVDMTPGGIKTSYVIRYCPLHTSAGEMLDTLKKIERFAFKASGDEFLMWAQEAISRAEGKERA